MTAATPVRSRHHDMRAIRYVVSGDAGAAEYSASAADGTPYGLGRHSRHPEYEGQEPFPCGIFAALPRFPLGASCYAKSTSTGADLLHEEWLAAGRDDEIIWRELEARYRVMADMAREV